jgi:hypothetical protein
LASCRASTPQRFALRQPRRQRQKPSLSRNSINQAGDALATSATVSRLRNSYG